MRQKQVATNRMQVSNKKKASTKQEAPVEGSLKLNVDASVFEGAPSFQLGLVFTDANGKYIRG